MTAIPAGQEVEAEDHYRTPVQAVSEPLPEKQTRSKRAGAWLTR
jgi:hypothetical protein